MNIYQKLLEVKRKVPYLQKDKEGHQYKYATPSQVLGTINPILNELGIILKTEVVSVEKERIFLKPKSVDVWVDGKKEQKVVDVYETLYFVKMKMTWVDTETGEKDENDWFASGVNGDEKGFGSSLTYGERYFILKYFNIPTDDDDPDSFQTKHLTQEEIEKRRNETQRRFTEECQKTAKSFSLANTIEELSEVKAASSPEVLKEASVILAAKRRYEELSSGNTTTPTAPVNDESNPSGLLKKEAEAPAPSQAQKERDELVAKYTELFGKAPHGKKTNETIMNEIEAYMAELEKEKEGTVSEEKPQGDGFLQEINEMQPEEKEIPVLDLTSTQEEQPANEPTGPVIGMFDEEGNYVGDPDKVEAQEELSFPDQIIADGRKFTERSAMVAWWKENVNEYKIKLTDDEMARVMGEFNNHFNTLPQ